MENAHLRLGLLEYVRITEKASTRIRLRVDRYIGEDRQAHLLSVFGNDSDVGAITAAVHEKARLTRGAGERNTLAPRTGIPQVKSYLQSAAAPTMPAWAEAQRRRVRK